MKRTQKRTNRDQSEFATVKGVNHHHLTLADTQRQAKKWEIFIVKNGKGFRCALMRDYWHGKTDGGLTGSPAANVFGLGKYLAFSAWF